MAEAGSPTPQAVSDSLDSISQHVGSILIRTVAGWSYLEAGPTGHVLKSNGPMQLPTWQAP